jgi:hypothetical protein
LLAQQPFKDFLLLQLLQHQLALLQLQLEHLSLLLAQVQSHLLAQEAFKEFPLLQPAQAQSLSMQAHCPSYPLQYQLLEHLNFQPLALLISAARQSMIAHASQAQSLKEFELGLQCPQRQLQESVH